MKLSVAPDPVKFDNCTVPAPGLRNAPEKVPTEDHRGVDPALTVAGLLLVPPPPPPVSSRMPELPTRCRAIHRERDRRDFA